MPELVISNTSPLLGIHLTRDSWNTTIITQNARKAASLAILAERA
jgi:hypothetical protein